MGRDDPVGAGRGLSRAGRGGASALASSAGAMHEGQLQVTAEIVAELISEQFPEWRQLPITRVQPGGTVNAIFRVGDDLAARLPLQPGDAVRARARLRSEAAAARRLAGCHIRPRPGHGGDRRTRRSLPDALVDADLAVGRRRPAWKTPATRRPSPRSWPASSSTCAPSTRRAAPSTARAAAATSASTRNGWPTASSRATGSSTCPACAASGSVCATSRGEPRTA